MTLNEAFEEACARLATAAFEALSPRDQILVTIWGLEAEVNNGGFDQYYFNSTGNQGWFAPEALSCIGAFKMASIVERANAFFGEAGPPRDSTKRQEALFAIKDGVEGTWDDLDREFWRYPDDIAALLVAKFSLSNLPNRPSAG